MLQVQSSVSSRGQVVIPKAVRQARGWGTNTRLIFTNRPEGVLVTKASDTPKEGVGLANLRFTLPQPKRKVTIEELCAPVTNYAGI